MTGNAANCRTALDAAASITVGDAAANSPTNGVASDGMRWYGEHVILTYDWCYAHMTAADKDTLLNRWNFYLNNIRQHAWAAPRCTKATICGVPAEHARVGHYHVR